MTGSKYADGLTHGHCRHCEGSAVLVDNQWWANAESECSAAPVRVCPECAGAQGEDVCPRCFGQGFVPGPHWPWRHPEP